MTRTRTMRLPALMALVGALLMLHVTPATASGPGAVAIAGQAALDGGLGTSGSGCFEGTAVGAHAEPEVAAASKATATVDNYDNTDLAVGTADGTLTVQTTELPSLGAGSVSVNYDWLRVGATAVLTFSGSHLGAGVAAFAPNPTGPTPGLPNCDAGAGLYAIVTGAGVII